MFIAGDSSNPQYQQIKTALFGLKAIFPEEIQVETIEFNTNEEYLIWLENNKNQIGAPNHSENLLVWFEPGIILGGYKDSLNWCRSVLSSTVPLIPRSIPNVDPWNPSHSYDYDLIVIGGGSGGLACAKEAVTINPELRVCLLDFVKPSPAGSKWGLGGTCVNVGCIPKKLMHTAALYGDHAKDAALYGWEGGVTNKHSWETLKNNSQDHIKGLNFGYRVELREKGVTYINKLAKFIDPHTLEVSDKKGAKTITGARIVVAVGGRPTPLQCEGSEFAISSDDLFMKSEPPGKTCVVGAGYVALECAGFIQGLKQADVTVLVRSILLRGFDRDLVNSVHSSLTHHGVIIKEGVLPTKITKQPNGKLLVTISDGTEEEFDTVLGAVGRYADTPGLNLPAVGVQIDSKNGKINCVNEQTSVPNIYAIGDVVNHVPELTPAAIKAGILLARRLFGGSHETMDYSKIATTVFTPLELGTVGLTEEAAIEKYGAENVDCVISSFLPLEWTVAHDNHEGVSCLAKIVLNISNDKEILGLHIAAPNAGEIIQGLAVAFRKGLKHKDLLDTVGIHPTTAEEFTTMSVLKSSGASAEKKGC